MTIEQQSRHDGCFNKGDNNGGEEKCTDLGNILDSSKLDVGAKENKTLGMHSKFSYFRNWVVNF